MLTIRHIEPGSGYEAIYETKAIWREPSAPGDVFAETGRGEEPLRFGTGSVFVMNDNGKTIAVYYLPVPLEDSQTAAAAEPGRKA